MRPIAVCVSAMGLLLASCAAAPPTTTAGPPETTTSMAVTTSTVTSTTVAVTSTTTSTTSPAPTVSGSVVNGLSVEDPALLERRILAVKIDNHSQARPQSGIDQADMVIELMVEGITRFISIWHQSDYDYLGPVRSGRPTDAALLQAMGEPTFTISGAQGWVYDIFASHDINMLGESRDGLFRIGSRSAPHNLYADTFRLRASADRAGYPDEAPDTPLWEFGPMSGFAPPASSVLVDFSGNFVTWTWHEEAGLWLRSVSGGKSMWRTADGETGQIGVPVLVALYVEIYSAEPPGPGSPVPASRTVGSGRAYVFAEGKVTSGTWRRSSESEWFLLTDDNGEILLVPPGKVWVSLVPRDTGLSVSD